MSFAEWSNDRSNSGNEKSPLQSVELLEDFRNCVNGRACGSRLLLHRLSIISFFVPALLCIKHQLHSSLLENERSL